jgi:hypothetical protein
MPHDMKNLIFVDCEATGPCPGKGELTQFGAVDFTSRQTFHGVLFESRPNADNPAHSEITGRAFDQVQVFTDFEQWLLSVTNGRCIFVSDNPAYDFQWINYGFHHAIGRNPFGHSGRRIGDFYAGLVADFGNSQAWKRLRITPHDHNPVSDAMGNVEAFERLLNGER